MPGQVLPQGLCTDHALWHSIISFKTPGANVTPFPLLSASPDEPYLPAASPSPVGSTKEGAALVPTPPPQDLLDSWHIHKAWGPSLMPGLGDPTVWHPPRLRRHWNWVVVTRAVGEGVHWPQTNKGSKTEFFFFNLSLCSFIFEREREWDKGRERGRQSPKQAPEPSAGLGLMNREIMT